jgi:copper chaperone CopZ
MKAYLLHVPSIGCQGCMSKIVKQVQTLPGIEIVETTVATKSLQLRYDPDLVSDEAIKQAVQVVGHRFGEQSGELMEAPR